MASEMKRLFSTLLLLALALPARATVYVVTPRGADSNPGTAARPFQTIGKAASVAGPGDTVKVKAGLYREAVRLSRSGTAKAPIQFAADPPGSVVVSGADIVSGWTRTPGDAPVYQIPWNFVFAIDFHDGKPVEAHPEDEPLWGRAEQVIADARQLLPTLGLDGLQKAWAAHPKNSPTVPSPLPHLGGPFAGCFAVDTTKKLLYVWLADGSDPNKHRMEAATREQTFGDNPWENPKGVQYVQVRGFVFRYGASFPQRAVAWLYGAHNLMENCVIEQAAGGGVHVSGTLRRCVVRNCGQTGGCADGDGFLNEECLWEGNCWKPISRNWDAGGVKLTLANGGTFRRCVFRRNGGPGLWFDIDVRNVLVTECVFEKNEGSGLFVEISRKNKIVRNLAVGNATGAVGHGENDWSAGGIQIGESEDCVIANNTCVLNKDGITFREGGPRPLDTPDGQIVYHNTGNRVTQNICAANQGYALGLWYDNGFFGRHPSDSAKYPTEAAFSDYLQTVPDKVYDPMRQNQTIDRNLYSPLPGKPVALYGVTWRVRHQEFTSLASFSARTGFDSRSRVADPLFVNLKAGNFRLRPDSPARKMGAGWTDPPANVDKWMTGFLPAFAFR